MLGIAENIAKTYNKLPQTSAIRTVMLKTACQDQSPSACAKIFQVHRNSISEAVSNEDRDFSQLKYPRTARNKLVYIKINQA